jgi:allantoicase
LNNFGNGWHTVRIQEKQHVVPGWSDIRIGRRSYVEHVVTL